MIEAIVGPPGAGKTLMMVRLMIKEQRRHELRKKYLNDESELIQIANFPVDEEILPNVIYLDNKDISTFYEWVREKKYFGASFYIDEMSILFPSLAWTSIPQDVILALRQHRHSGYNIFYTAQDLDDVSKGVRVVTQFCTQVDGFSLFRFSTFTCFSVKRGKINFKDKFNKGLYIHKTKYYQAYNTRHDVVKPEYLDIKV